MLLHAALAIAFGLWLVSAPEQVFDLMMYLRYPQVKLDPGLLGVLRFLGVILVCTGLPLWILPEPELNKHQEKFLRLLAGVSLFFWFTLPQAGKDDGGGIGGCLGLLLFALLYVLLKWGTPAVSQSEELSELAARQERNRLARDLHDSIKQQLFSIKMSSAAAEERWNRDPGGARAALADVRRSAHYAMVEMQAMLAQLRPEPLATVGLVDALREQCEALGYRLGVPVDFAVGDLPEDERLPVSTQENLFRIAQEGLSNIARHARPSSVQVRLEADGPDLRLSIRDEGQGFDPAAPSAGMGLRSMRERLAALGGDLDIESAPGQGTALSARVPLTVPSPDESDESLRLRRVKVCAFFAFLALLGIGETLVVSASALFFAGRISLKERSRRSRSLSQQSIFVAALLFWWYAGTTVPELPSATLAGLQWYEAMLEYALTQAARLISPLSLVLIAWELWKSRRAADSLYYNRELVLFVLLLLLASLPFLLTYDPGLVGNIASRMAALAYAVWFLRLLAGGR